MILVVDDHAVLLELVREALEQEGFEVGTEKNVADALKCLRTHAVELVVLDLGLPDESGLSLCRRLRAEGNPVPILILTAKGAVRSRVECLDAGADDYLTKPFAVAELKARIRALLRRAKSPGPRRYERGPTSLDFGAKHALVSGKEAPITAREWAILEVLWEAAGAVVSRQRLLEQVWSAGDESKLASLDVLVSRIRRKLGTDVVRTLRNGGYALPLEGE